MLFRVINRKFIRIGPREVLYIGLRMSEVQSFPVDPIAFECFGRQVQGGYRRSVVAIRPSGVSMRAGDPIHTMFLGSARISLKGARVKFSRTTGLNESDSSSHLSELAFKARRLKNYVCLP